MDGKFLVFELRQPFDRFVDYNDHPDWLAIVREFRTEWAAEQVSRFQLQTMETQTKRHRNLSRATQTSYQPN